MMKSQKRGGLPFHLVRGRVTRYPFHVLQDTFFVGLWTKKRPCHNVGGYNQWKRTEDCLFHCTPRTGYCNPKFIVLRSRPKVNFFLATLFLASYETVGRLDRGGSRIHYRKKEGSGTPSRNLAAEATCRGRTSSTRRRSPPHCAVCEGEPGAARTSHTGLVEGYPPGGFLSRRRRKSSAAS